MDTSEKDFFESLARGTPVSNNDEDDQKEPEVELVKASAAMVNSQKVAVHHDEPMTKTGPTEPEGQLTIDVFQTPTEIVIESAIAGVEEEDLDVNVSTDSVTIRGQRRHHRDVKDEDYLYQECYWGRFSRSVILPQEIDPEGASVIFKNGILTVHLPKLNRKRTKKLKVKFE